MASPPPTSSPRRGLRAVAAMAAALAGCSGDDGGADPAPSPVVFQDIAAEVGLAVVHDVALRGDYALPEIVGSGAAVFDADGDGAADVYLVQAGRTRGDGAPNRLFLRRGERYVETPCGLEDAGYGMGVAVADVDNDGDADVFCSNWGRDALYLNDGTGTFEPAPDSPFAASDWSTSCAFFDYDLDGLLDLWVCAYVDFVAERLCHDGGGRREYCGPRSFDGVRDTLYRNMGGGRFVDVSAIAGIDTRGAGLGVIVDDFDGDGRPDVYVANDQDPNHLWMNRKSGLVNEALARGVAVNSMGSAESSMGVTCGDVDGDGDRDLFMTHLDGETNTLYLHDDAGIFRDATTRSGLAEPSLQYTGFGTVLFDFDDDGDLDAFAANGRVARRAGAADARAGSLSGYGEPNQLFVNDGRGRFTEHPGAGLSTRWEVSRGLIPFDHDGDGDQDLLVTNCGGPVRLLENLSRGGRWLRVEPRDEGVGRAVIGALVRVHAGGRVHEAVFTTSASYLSSWLLPHHFGLGDVAAVDAIEVVWPGGERERFPGGPTNRCVRIVRGSSR